MGIVILVHPRQQTFRTDITMFEQTFKMCHDHTPTFDASSLGFLSLVSWPSCFGERSWQAVAALGAWSFKHAMQTCVRTWNRQTERHTHTHTHVQTPLGLDRWYIPSQAWPNFAKHAVISHVVSYLQQLAMFLANTWSMIGQRQWPMSTSHGRIFRIWWGVQLPQNPKTDDGWVWLIAWARRILTTSLTMTTSSDRAERTIQLSWFEPSPVLGRIGTIMVKQQDLETTVKPWRRKQNPPYYYLVSSELEQHTDITSFKLNSWEEKMRLPTPKPTTFRSRSWLDALRPRVAFFLPCGVSKSRASRAAESPTWIVIGCVVILKPWGKYIIMMNPYYIKYMIYN